MLLFEKLLIPQIAKKFASFHGTRQFITMFTKAHHFSSIISVV
jgi:hypothetical protein